MHFLLVHLISLHLSIPLAANVPGGNPTAPPGTSQGITNIVNWGEWLAIVAGLAGLIRGGVALAHAHGEGSYGAQHRMGVIWAMAGCVFIGAAGAIAKALTG